MVEIKVYVKHFCQVYNVDYGGGGGHWVAYRQLQENKCY